MKNDLKEPEVIHSDTREYLQDLHNEVLNGYDGTAIPALPCEHQITDHGYEVIYLQLLTA